MELKIAYDGTKYHHKIGGAEYAYVKCTGAFDHHSSKKFAKKTLEGICNKETNILLDMAEVDFIDSGGLSCFVICRELLKPKNGHIVLLDTPVTIKEVCEISQIYPNIVDYVESSSFQQ